MVDEQKCDTNIFFLKNTLNSISYSKLSVDKKLWIKFDK